MKMTKEFKVEFLIFIAFVSFTLLMSFRLYVNYLNYLNNENQTIDDLEWFVIFAIAIGIAGGIYCIYFQLRTITSLKIVEQ